MGFIKVCPFGQGVTERHWYGEEPLNRCSPGRIEIRSGRSLGGVSGKGKDIRIRRPFYMVQESSEKIKAVRYIVDRLSADCNKNPEKIIIFSNSPCVAEITYGVKLCLEVVILLRALN